MRKEKAVKACCGNEKQEGKGMTANQEMWVSAKARLMAASASLGLPEEFADLLARQLGSPRAMDRMTSYLRQAHPRTVEMIIDEMLAICADAEAWREKKESQRAQAGYSAWLNSEERWQNTDEDEE